MHLLKSGDHVVVIDDVYGGTQRYFRRVADVVRASHAPSSSREHVWFLWGVVRVRACLLCGTRPWGRRCATSSSRLRT